MIEPGATFSRMHPRLTDEAVTTMVLAEARAMGQPQCIALVDASGVLLAHLRMDGAKVLSLQSALAKAETASSINAPTHSVPPEVAVSIAAATNGRLTRLPGGLPIRIAGHLVGGIGIGSGSGKQDVTVALAALRVIGAEVFDELP